MSAGQALYPLGHIVNLAKPEKTLESFVPPLGNAEKLKILQMKKVADLFEVAQGKGYNLKKKREIFSAINLEHAQYRSMRAKKPLLTDSSKKAVRAIHSTNLQLANTWQTVSNHCKDALGALHSSEARGLSDIHEDLFRDATHNLDQTSIAALDLAIQHLGTMKRIARRRAIALQHSAKSESPQHAKADVALDGLLIGLCTIWEHYTKKAATMSFSQNRQRVAGNFGKFVELFFQSFYRNPPQMQGIALRYQRLCSRKKALN